MDLWAWHLKGAGFQLSDRQRRSLDRIQQRAQIVARGMDMRDFDAEVGRFFEVYNAAWSHNWGFAPMPEVEIQHLAKQVEQIINPNWAFGLETRDGMPVAVCLALPDVNRLMLRVRSGRLLADPHFRTAEASWTLASNDRINHQIEAMGGRRTKVWRIYRRQVG